MLCIEWDIRNRRKIGIGMALPERQQQTSLTASRKDYLNGARSHDGTWAEPISFTRDDPHLFEPPHSLTRKEQEIQKRQSKLLSMF